MNDPKIEITETLMETVVKFAADVLDWYRLEGIDRQQCYIDFHVESVQGLHETVHQVTLKDYGPCPMQILLPNNELRITEQ